MKLDQRVLQPPSDDDPNSVELGLRRYNVDATPSVRVHTLLYSHDVKALDKFRKEFKEATGRNLSRSFILRGGYPAFIKELRGMLSRAQHGEYHAKKRDAVPRLQNSRKGQKVPNRAK